MGLKPSKGPSNCLVNISAMVLVGTPQYIIILGVLFSYNTVLRTIHTPSETTIHTLKWVMHENVLIEGIELH